MDDKKVARTNGIQEPHSPGRGRERRSGVNSQLECIVYPAIASLNRSGFFSAILRRVAAAPEGFLRPCSQSCRVRTETPRTSANSTWERPEAFRTRAAAGRETETLFPFPAWISRTPSRTSCQISRSFFCFLFWYHLLFFFFFRPAALPGVRPLDFSPFIGKPKCLTDFRPCESCFSRILDRFQIVPDPPCNAVTL